jgi:hypothetical protein
MAKTLDQIYEDIDVNIDFEETNSVSKASALVSDLKRLLIVSPQNQSDQGSSMTMSVVQIENLMKRAQDFIAVNRVSAGAVRFLSVSEDFR